MRGFWIAWWAVFTMGMAFFASLPLGPSVEERLYPIRVRQTVTDVTRNGRDLCWTWNSVKTRPVVSVNLDLFVDVAGKPGAVGAPWERDSGMPWQASRAVAVGPEMHRQSYCVTLPPYVKPDMPVRVRQTAYYPGLFGLWTVAVHIPENVDPAGSVIP